MWLAFAFGSAFFAGITAILAKCGIKKTDSTVATAIRTAVVLIMAVLMSYISGSLNSYGNITPRTWLFLVLSGLATGASWLCYFRALQIGDVNKVVPIDKSSVILTLILAFIFFDEKFTAIKILCIALIGVGTLLMIEKKNSSGKSKKRSWIIYAVMSAVFASLTAILGKIGIDGVESNLGTAIRTAVVLVMAWFMVFVTGKTRCVREAPGKELVFICLSGLATGGSWLCYYKALQLGPTATVVAIDKLSIIITVAFSWIVFKEKLTVRSGIGLAMIVGGTLLMLI